MVGAVCRTSGHGAASLLGGLRAILADGRGISQHYYSSGIRRAANLRSASLVVFSYGLVFGVLTQIQQPLILGRGVGLSALV